MRKTLLLTMVLVLAIGLLWAWAGQPSIGKKPVIPGASDTRLISDKEVGLTGAAPAKIATPVKPAPVAEGASKVSNTEDPAVIAAKEEMKRTREMEAMKAEKASTIENPEQLNEAVLKAIDNQRSEELYQLIYGRQIDQQNEPPVIAANLLNENFEGAWGYGVPPAGWTVLDSGSEGQQFWWTDDFHKFYYSATGWNDTVARSLYYSNSAETLYNDWLITPVFDLTSATTCSLWFKEYYQNGSSTRDSCMVHISTDNGTTWTELRKLKASTANPNRPGFNLDAYVGNSQCRIGFQHVVGGKSTPWQWYIDSVRVIVDGSPIFTENFNNWGVAGYPAWGNTPPPGWTIYDNGTPGPASWNNNDWYRRQTMGTGNNAAGVTYSATYNEFENEYLISPMFTIPGSVPYCSLSTAEYYSHITGTPLLLGGADSGMIMIQTTTDGGLTWGPWNTIFTNKVTKGSASSKVTFKYDLSGYIGQTCRLGFNFRNAPNADGDTWYVDDVRVFVPDFADDITALAIPAPTGWINDYLSYAVRGRFRNSGTTAQTFDGIMTTNDGYVDTVYGISLNPLAETTVTFDNYVAAGPGLVTFSLYADNPGEQNLADNTFNSSITVYPHAGTGGPDAQLYSWIDNTQPGGPTFSWVDMSSATVCTLSSYDTGVSTAKWLGGSFYFYGQMYDSVKIGANGLLTLDIAQTSLPDANYAIPTAGAPNTILAGYWDDMNSRVGAIKYLIDAPNNRFVVEYDSLIHYGQNALDLDMQIIINWGDSTITYQYNNISPNMQTDVTIGIENQTGTTGLQYFFETDLGNYPWDGLAVKFYYTAPALDAGVTSIDSPAVNFVPIGVYNVWATATNFTATPSVVNVNFFVDALPLGTAVGILLPPFGSVPVLCPTPWPAAIGPHVISAATVLPGDGYPTNDASSKSVVVYNLTGLPFFTDFEANDGGFLPVAGEWEWGVPTYGSGPASAYSPVNCWGTDLDNTYDPSTLNALLSQGLTLTGGAIYQASFWLWYYTEGSGFDGCNVKISTDGGATWSVITTSRPYNSTITATSNPMLGQPVWNGQSLGWVQVTIDLTPYAGQTVLLRFDMGGDSSVQYAGMYIDDFNAIFINNDIGVTDIVDPCALAVPGSYSITAYVKNFTGNPVTGAQVDFYEGANLIGSATGINIPGNDSVLVTCPTAWTPVAGNYTLTATSILAGDSNPINDSKSEPRSIRTAATLPLTENFDGGVFPPAGWTVLDYGNATADGWMTSSVRYRSSPNSAFVDDDPSTSVKNEWLILPPLDFSTATSPRFTFYEDQTYWTYYGDHHRMYIATGPCFDPATATLLADHTPANHTINGFGGAPVAFDLTPYAGNATVWLALQYTGNYADEWYVDDVEVNPTAIYCDLELLDFGSMPAVVTPGTTIYPEVNIRNNAVVGSVGDVTITITGALYGPIYSDVVTGVSFGAGATVLVNTFDPFVTGGCADDYTVSAVVTVTSCTDEVPGNNNGSYGLTVGYGAYASYFTGGATYYTSGKYHMGHLYVKPTVGTIDHFLLALQSAAVPRPQFGWSIYGYDGSADTGTARVAGPFYVTCDYPNYTRIDISPALYASLPDTFVLMVWNRNGQGAPNYTGPLFRTQGTQEFYFGLANNTGDSSLVRNGTWMRASTAFGQPFYMQWYVHYDNRPANYIDAEAVSIDEPNGVAFGTPVPVKATYFNNGLAPITGATAYLNITGPDTYSDTVTGVTIPDNGFAQIDFGTWTPGFDTSYYVIDIVLVTGEGDTCDNRITVTTFTFDTLGVNRGVMDQLGDSTDFTVPPILTGNPWSFGTDPYFGTPLSGRARWWGARMVGPYQANDCGPLVSRTVTLAPTWRGYALLDLAYENELDWDFANVKITTDGGSTWNVLAPILGYPSVDTNTGNLCPLMSLQPGFTGYRPWHYRLFDLRTYAGQTISLSVDFASDAYTEEHGTQIGTFKFMGPLMGYEYLPGDANMGVAPWPPQVSGADVTRLVGYFKGIFPACEFNNPGAVIAPPNFYASGDANGNCALQPSDVTRLVAYFKGTAAPPAACSDYPPVAPVQASYPACTTPPLRINVIPSEMTR